MTPALRNISGYLFQLIHAVCLAALVAVAAGVVQKIDFEKFRAEHLTKQTRAPGLSYQNIVEPKGGYK